MEKYRFSANRTDRRVPCCRVFVADIDPGEIQFMRDNKRSFQFSDFGPRYRVTVIGAAGGVSGPILHEELEMQIGTWAAEKA